MKIGGPPKNPQHPLSTTQTPPSFFYTFNIHINFILFIYLNELKSPIGIWTFKTFFGVLTKSAFWCLQSHFSTLSLGLSASRTFEGWTTLTFFLYNNFTSSIFQQFRIDFCLSHAHFLLLLS